jgi:hypothetical protein
VALRFCTGMELLAAAIIMIRADAQPC